MLTLNHGELIHRPPVVIPGIIEIDQTDMIARNATILALVLHSNAVAKRIPLRRRFTGAISGPWMTA